MRQTLYKSLPRRTNRGWFGLVWFGFIVKYSLADNMGQGEGPTVPLQSDAPEKSDLWTAW